MLATVRVDTALQRLKGVYFESPDAQLSLDEASTISGLDADCCRSILSALVDVRFLERDGSGAYRRRMPITTEH